MATAPKSFKTIDGETISVDPSAPRTSGVLITTARGANDTTTSAKTLSEGLTRLMKRNDSCSVTLGWRTTVRFDPRADKMTFEVKPSASNWNGRTEVFALSGETARALVEFLEA